MAQGDPWTDWWTGVWGGGKDQENPEAPNADEQAAAPQAPPPQNPYAQGTPDYAWWNAGQEAQGKVDQFQGWGGLSSDDLQERVAAGAWEDYHNAVETNAYNQRLDQIQADKYIAESSQARTNALSKLDENLTGGLADIAQAKADAATRRADLKTAGNDAYTAAQQTAKTMRDNAQTDYKNAAAQLEKGRGQTFDVWNQTKTMIQQSLDRGEEVYNNATKAFKDFQTFRDQTMAKGEANADKTIAMYADQTAQNVSVALNEMQGSEKQAIEQVLQAAKQSGRDVNDPNVQAEIRSIRQNGNIKRAELATQSGQQANEFRAKLASEMYNQLSASGAEWGKSTASALATYVDAGKALDDVRMNGASVFSTAAGKVMDAISQINASYTELNKSLMGVETAAGEAELKGIETRADLYKTGAELQNQIETTALNESIVMRSTYNENRAQLEQLATTMRDSEYSAYLDAYSKQVVPLFPTMAALGNMSISEDQRQFENNMAIFNTAVNTVTTALGWVKPHRYRYGGGGGGDGASSGEAVATAAGSAGASTAATLGTLAILSDQSLKHDIQDAEVGIPEVMALRPVEFAWNGSNREDMGLIAQEVQQVLPKAVLDLNGHLGINYAGVVSTLVGAVQQLARRVAELEADRKSEVA